MVSLWTGRSGPPSYSCSLQKSGLLLRVGEELKVFAYRDRCGRHPAFVCYKIGVSICG